MFLFLIILGTLLMGWGLIKRKEENAARGASDEMLPVFEAFLRPQEEDREALSLMEDERLEDLSSRMTELEKTFFSHLMAWQEEKAALEARISPEMEREDKESDGQKMTLMFTPVEAVEKKPMPEHIKTVLDYEDQGLSVAEIAKITRMNKGEVLLLRNLSKHYRR